VAASDYRQSCCGRYVMLSGGLALPIEPILLAVLALLDYRPESVQ
jgi:hypothetical protein